MLTRLLDLLPVPLSRLVATLGLSAYLIGTIASLAMQNPHIFQRFGSLGVAAAILFFSDRLMQIELRRQKTVERILHEYGLELEVLKEGVSATDLPKEGFLTDYLSEEARFSTLRGHAERITSRNILLLTAATLQWGFGDAFLGWILS